MDTPIGSRLDTVRASGPECGGGAFATVNGGVMSRGVGPRPSPFGWPPGTGRVCAARPDLWRCAGRPSGHARRGFGVWWRFWCSYSVCPNSNTPVCLGRLNELDTCSPSGWPGFPGCTRFRPRALPRSRLVRVTNGSSRVLHGAECVSPKQREFISHGTYPV